MTGCGRCFKCKEGRGCIRDFVVPASATPSRTQGAGKPRSPDPAWERGTAGEERPDGSFMPYVDSKGTSIGVKQYADNRSGFEKTKRELAQGTRINSVS